MFKIVSTCKGGGYRYCRTEPPHPKRNAKGLYPLHRVIVENKIGRELLPSEDVHHIDGNKSNDAPENLAPIVRSRHKAIHGRERRARPVLLACGACSTGFELPAHTARLRRKRNKSGEVFCCRKCARSYQSLAR